MNNRHHHSSNNRYTVRHNANIRFLHNVAGGPGVDIEIFHIMKKIKELNNVNYKTISPYINVVEGKYRIIVKAGNSVLIDEEASLQAGVNYTVIVHGLIKDLKSIKALTIADDLTCPMNGKSHVKFIHSAAGNPAVDVYLNRDIAFKNESYGMATGYTPVNSNGYTVSVTVTGSYEPVLQTELNLGNRKIYSIFATGIAGNKDYPLNAIVSVDNECTMMY